jgi:hypothetical protein
MYQAKEVRRGKRALTLYITLWSDDFETNNCNDNQGSDWVMTTTIATPTNNHHTIYNTSFIAGVGTKYVDHQPVYDRVMSNLERRIGDRRPQLNLNYSKVGGNVRVSCGWYNYLSDQPEKSTLTGLGGGNANFSGQYGKAVLYMRN